MMPLIDLTGRIIGDVTVLGRDGSFGKHPRWLVRCKCGRKRYVRGQTLRRGETSCRHLHKHPRYKELHSIWSGMKDRCLNPLNPNYKRYGGRGVAICPRWLDFNNFAEDLPPRPQPWRKYSVDRIDAFGNYEITNVRWATSREQQNNRRYNVRLPFDGSRLTRQRRQQIANNLRGLCQYCKAKVVPGARLCQKHLDKSRESSRERYRTRIGRSLVNRRWTIGDDEQLIALYNGGTKLREIAKDVGRSTGSLLARLQSLRGPRRLGYRYNLR